MLSLQWTSYGHFALMILLDTHLEIKYEPSSADNITIMFFFISLRFLPSRILLMFVCHGTAGAGCCPLAL